MVKSHFVLIHGSSYGAWCCHNVTTLDMAACGMIFVQY